MKITEVIQLLRAGYTKAEIDELRNQETSSSIGTAEPIVLPSSGDVTAGEPVPEVPGNAPEQNSEEIAELKQMVSNLQKLVQKQNIQQSELKPVPPESAVDILASIINPPKKEK